MYYVQRELTDGYEYVTGEPIIADGDVTAEWGSQSKAMPFDESTAVKWAGLFGCGVTLFEAPAVIEEMPKVDPDEARRARVAAHLAAPELPVAEALKKAEEAVRVEADEGLEAVEVDVNR